jgi:hypothetical protein
VTHKLQKTQKKCTLYLESVIKFTIALASVTPVTAEAHMVEEVNNAEQAEQQMHLVPSAIGRGEGALDDLNSIASNIISVVELWQPLLENVQLFMNVMDKIAEVWHWFQRLHLLNVIVAARSIPTRRWLGAF